MCKGPSAPAPEAPSWCIERSASVWRCKVAVSKLPELEINAASLRLILDPALEAFDIQIPEHALPVDPDATRCKFSKKRSELVIEWPCSADQTTSDRASESEVAPIVEAVVPSNVEDDKGASAGIAAVDSAEASSDTPGVSKNTDDSLPAANVAVPAEAMDSGTSAEAVSETTASREDSPHVKVNAPEKAAETPESEEPSVTAEEWKARGNAAVKISDLETAVACYTSGIAVVDSAEAEVLLHSNRALCLHKLCRHQEAVDDAKKCIDLNPSFIKGYLRGALALRSLARPAEALALLRRAPNNDEACDLAAEIRTEAEVSEKARIEALPEAERAKEEGNVLFKKGLFEPAAVKYAEALGLCAEPEGSLALSIRNNRAACNHQVSDFDAVIKDTNFVLAREPHNLKALLRRMLALEPLERYEQSLKDARAILAQDPRNEVANKVQHRLGKLVRDMGRAGTGA